MPGWGGARVGAGKKPKSLAEKTLHGTASIKEQRESKPIVIRGMDVPEDLTPEECAIWRRLAPYALEARTLTKATAEAFADLCRNRALMLRFAKSGAEAGGPNHRGLLQRVQSQMKDFSLSPFGKPIIGEAPKVEDPFAELDATVN